VAQAGWCDSRLQRDRQLENAAAAGVAELDQLRLGSCVDAIC